MIRLALLSTVVVATALPARALAEPEPPPAPPLTWAAGELVELGLAAHARGDYPAALTAFELAAALAPHPLLDFDRAQTLRLAGRDAEALVAYRAFLAAEPAGPEAELARGFAATLAARVDRERARAREPEAPPPLEPSPAVPPPRRGGRALRVVGVTSATLGVGALGAATYFALSARSTERTLSTPGATYDPALDARGRRDARWATITALAGGALVVTGAGLYLAGHRRGAAVLAPSATREQVALVVTGSWR